MVDQFTSHVEEMTLSRYRRFRGRDELRRDLHRTERPEPNGHAGAPEWQSRRFCNLLQAKQFGVAHRSGMFP